jgi:hypothetical protein
VRTVTGAASSVARAAIVSADATWQPSATIYEFATFDTSATAVVTKSVSQALSAGRYLIAFKTEVGNPTLAYNSFAYGSPVGSAQLALSAGSGNVGRSYTVSTSAGAYANPTPAWTAFQIAACPFYMRWTA